MQCLTFYLVLNCHHFKSNKSPWCYFFACKLCLICTIPIVFCVTFWSMFSSGYICGWHWQMLCRVLSREWEEMLSGHSLCITSKPVTSTDNWQQIISLFFVLLFCDHTGQRDVVTAIVEIAAMGGSL